MLSTLQPQLKQPTSPSLRLFDGISASLEREEPPCRAASQSGAALHARLAKPSVFDGIVYYFCSRDCREVFEAAPHTYVAGERPVSILQLEHGYG